MNPILEVLPQIQAYQLSLLGLAILCLMVLLQSFLSAPLAFLKEEQTPGMPLTGNHDIRSFRVLRTYANSTENLPAFGFSLFLAILFAVNPTLVNWLVAIHVASRFAFWVVYYKGIGKVAGGIRTFCYIGGLASNIVLISACLYTLLK